MSTLNWIRIDSCRHEARHDGWHASLEEHPPGHWAWRVSKPGCPSSSGHASGSLEAAKAEAERGLSSAQRSEASTSHHHSHPDPYSTGGADPLGLWHSGHAGTFVGGGGDTSGGGGGTTW